MQSKIPLSPAGSRHMFLSKESRNPVHVIHFQVLQLVLLLLLLLIIVLIFVNIFSIPRDRILP